jgi:hypothetical protein
MIQKSGVKKILCLTEMKLRPYSVGWYIIVDSHRFCYLLAERREQEAKCQKNASKVLAKRQQDAFFYRAENVCNVRNDDPPNMCKQKFMYNVNLPM